MPEHMEDCPARYGLGRCDCDNDPPGGLVGAEQDDNFDEEEDYDDYYGYADPGDADW